MNKSYIIRTKNLTKCFEETVAINNIDLVLEPGKVYGLIGRNGAGKTTLLKLISNMLLPTSGQIETNTEYLPKPEDISFGRAYNFKYFTQKIKNIFKIASMVNPDWKEEYVTELVEAFELDTKKTYHRSSTGMQTMTGLIIALASNPKLLLLDEPYVGLDPVNREVFYHFLRNHYFDGEKTVVISSHIIKEIEGYFEKAIMLEKGNIVLNEELEELKKKSLIVSGGEKLAEYIENNFSYISKETLGNHFTYYIYDKMRDLERSQICSMGGEVQSMDLQTLMVKLSTKGDKK